MFSSGVARTFVDTSWQLVIHNFGFFTLPLRLSAVVLNIFPASEMRRAENRGVGRSFKRGSVYFPKRIVQQTVLNSDESGCCLRQPRDVWRRLRLPHVD